MRDPQTIGCSSPNHWPIDLLACFIIMNKYSLEEAQKFVDQDVCLVQQKTLEYREQLKAIITEHWSQYHVDSPHV